MGVRRIKNHKKSNSNFLTIAILPSLLSLESKKRYNFIVDTVGYPPKIYLVTPLLNLTDQIRPTTCSHITISKISISGRKDFIP